MTMMVTPSKSTKGTSNSLSKRISDRKDQICPWCNNCNHPGHWTSKCHKLTSNKCYNCQKYGHHTKDCWNKAKGGGNSEKKKNWKEKRKVKDPSESKDEQANTTMEVAFPIQEEDMELHNFSNYDACNSSANDERLIWYDWVADTATTSHITHQKDAFIDYTPSNNTSVTGVGGRTAKIAGRDTVVLISTFNGTVRETLINTLFFVRFLSRQLQATPSSSEQLRTTPDNSGQLRTRVTN